MSQVPDSQTVPGGKVTVPSGVRYSAREMHQTATAKPGVSRLKYIGEIISELKKVVWLTRREATYLTVLVLIVAVAAGVILGLIDFGFAGLIDKIVLGK